MRNIYFFLFILLLGSCSKRSQIYQWRGENRDGIYHENGLMQQWPEEGPQLLWESDSIGNGYGSPVITENSIYVTGEMDSILYLFSYDLNGREIWRSEIGKEWTVNFPGSRSTPTVIDNLIYVSTGLGTVACFEVTGEKVWSINLMDDFNGRNVRFGYTQSWLVDEDNIYCFPGGADTNIVALNRFTGETFWMNSGNEEIGAYAGPIMINLENRKILVSFSIHHLVGYDAENGDTLWSHPQKMQGDIHGNTPIYDNGYIYYVAGGGNGAVKLQLSENGDSIAEIWRTMKMDNIMGGFVKLDTLLIGSGHRKQVWKRIHTETGELVDTLSIGASRGATIYADNRIYAYTEKGKVALLKNAQDGLKIISSFMVEKGTGEHFAHPVIKNGVLYIRHGKLLLAYTIKQEQV